MNLRNDKNERLIWIYCSLLLFNHLSTKCIQNDFFFPENCLFYTSLGYHMVPDFARAPEATILKDEFGDIFVSLLLNYFNNFK